jgi:hypothetical protein
MKRALVLVLCSVLALTACGNDDDGGTDTAETPGESPATTENVVEVGVTEFEFNMPDTVSGGVVTFRASNTGGLPHELAFGRIEGDHDIDDVMKAIRAEKEPEWFADIAGIGLLGSGTTASMTRTLDEGRYIFMCFLPTSTGEPHIMEGMVKVFDVEGVSDAEFPQADLTITATQEGFEMPSTVEAGTHVVELVNADKKPHEFQMFSPDEGKSVKDLEKWFGNNLKGDAPATLPGGFQSIEPGTEIFLELEFEAGRTYLVEDFEAGFQGEITVE